MAGVIKKGKSGNKKHGRMKKWCEAYRARHQREKNKLIRLRKHLLKHPNDQVAIQARTVCKEVAR